MAKKKETTAAPKSKKAATKKAAPATDNSVPQIDTDLAASNAAKALAAGLGTGATASSGTESASFKQMKAGLNKPTFATGSATGNLLGGLGGAAGKKGSQTFGGNKQVGRNQTFGADVNRTGVPRRTSGG